MTSGSDAAKPGGGHSFHLRVYYEDTDLAGIVYHANYLRFIERGRSEALIAAGVDQVALAREGVTFAVRRIAAEFVAPARLFDQLAVTTACLDAGGARVRLAQDVSRAGAVLFSAQVEIVCVGPHGRARRMPGDVRTALKALCASPHAP